MDDYTHLADQLREDAEVIEEHDGWEISDHLRQAADAIDRLEILANNYRKALEAMR